MKALLFFLAFPTIALAQSLSISPIAEFDLNASFRSHHLDRHAKSYFAATPNGLTLVTLSGTNVLFTSADLDGKRFMRGPIWHLYML